MDIAKSMEEAFAAGTPPVGIGKTAHAAALAWTMPGFAAFDTGAAEAVDTATDQESEDAPANTADAHSTRARASLNIDPDTHTHTGGNP